MCDHCESGHDVHKCLYCDYFEAQYARIEKTMKDMIVKMIETMKERIAQYSHCFSQSMEDKNLHEPD